MLACAWSLLRAGWKVEMLGAGIAPEDHRLAPLPGRLIHAGLKTAESFGLRLSFRSDSVLSLVNQNPAPDFSAIERIGIRARPWPETAAAARTTGD